PPVPSLALPKGRELALPMFIILCTQYSKKIQCFNNNIYCCAKSPPRSPPQPSPRGGNWLCRCLFYSFFNTPKNFNVLIIIIFSAAQSLPTLSLHPPLCSSGQSTSLKGGIYILP